MKNANQLCDDTPKLFRIYVVYIDIWCVPYFFTFLKLSLESWEIYSQTQKKSQSYLLYLMVMALFSSNKGTIPNNIYKIHAYVTIHQGSAKKKKKYFIYIQTNLIGKNE